MKKYLCFALMTIMLLMPMAGMAKADVSGACRADSSGRVFIDITVGHPSPMAFIVILNLPGGVKVLSASPQPSGLKNGGTKIKWLFKHAQPGQMSLFVQLSKPISRNLLMGEIRYRRPESGEMITKKIK